MTPYKMQNLVYEWVDFSKFGQMWAKIDLNLRRFWKKLVILFKIWPKIGPIGIWMGYFFLKNWYLYGSTFRFRGGTSLPKLNLTTPPPPGLAHFPQYHCVSWFNFNFFFLCFQHGLTMQMHVQNSTLGRELSRLILQGNIKVLRGGG